MRMLVRAFALGVAAVLAHLPTAPGAGAQSPIKNVLIIYGGPEAYPGSATFDASLRERDPKMGLRDDQALRALAREHGLRFTGEHAMPANNRLLLWTR